MNNKTIKSKRDLPNWFNDKEYEEISEPICWAVEICKRISLRSMIEPYSSLLDSGVEGYLTGRNLSQLEGVLSGQIYDSAACYSDTGRIIDTPLILGPIGVEPAVKDISHWDVIHLASVLPEWSNELISKVRGLHVAKKTDMRTQEDRLFLESSEYVHHRDEMLDALFSVEEIDGSTTDLLLEFDNPYASLARDVHGDACLVDLSQDDVTLTKSFLEWTRTARERGGYELKDRKSPLTENILLGWNKYKPLQVFDLDFWSRVSGNKITDGLIAKTLWPDGAEDAEDIDPVSRLRQVTRQTKVPSIISYEMLARLKGWIKNELIK